MYESGSFKTAISQVWILAVQKRGIIFKGHAPSLDIMGSYRVCLAPLRYGAGLKVHYTLTP